MQPQVTADKRLVAGEGGYGFRVQGEDFISRGKAGKAFLTLDDKEAPAIFQPAFSRRQCNALDAVVVPSSAMRQRLAEYGVTAPMTVLPTGIPLGQFAGGDGAAFRQRHGIAPQRPLALFVGRVAHEKNIGFLLDALAHAQQVAPGAMLMIAGEGPAMGDLRRRVQQLGLAAHVIFIGYLDRRQDLPACYAAADVFAFASRTETQGLVLLEAMAAALPVVALSAMPVVPCSRSTSLPVPSPCLCGCVSRGGWVGRLPGWPPCCWRCWPLPAPACWGRVISGHSH